MSAAEPRSDEVTAARVALARQRTMAERLALALSWNRVASELRVGLRGTGRSK